jgi:hypothetical protein
VSGVLLWLALLCQVAYRNPDADLPETKAGLYEQFVNYFYEWKPNITDIDWATSPALKQALHEALGRLALAGLDSEHRFRLPLNLIQQTMGDELFRLAWELGWLNVVDRGLKGDDPIYSFFHPTFQEFLAASVISNWDYFMPSDNIKPMHEKRFRIFEQSWREVLPLWMGLQKKGKIANLKKVIKMILDFEDGIDRFQFYKIRLRLMLLSCLPEIDSHVISDNLIDKCFESLVEISPSVINRHFLSDPLLEMELLAAQNPLDKSPRKVMQNFHADGFRRISRHRQRFIDDEMCLAICNELEEKLPKCNFHRMVGKEELEYSIILHDVEDLDFDIDSDEIRNRFHDLLTTSSTMANPMVWERAIKILSRLDYEYTIWLLEAWAENSIENQSKHRYYSIVLAEIANEDRDIHYFSVFQKVISGEDLEESIWALERLCRIAKLKQSAIKFHGLIDLLCQVAIKYSSVKFVGDSRSICEDCFPSELAARCLGEIGLPEPIIEQTLRRLFWETSEILIHCEIANVFIKLGFSTEEFWLDLADYFNQSEDWYLKTKITIMLADAGADIPDLDECLLGLVLNGLKVFSGEAEDLHDAVLKYCSPQLIIQSLKPCLTLEDQQEYPHFFDFCYKLLRDLASRVEYPVFHTLWHNNEAQNPPFFGDFFMERLNNYL